jgi:putative phage-type endonuclease
VTDQVLIPSGVLLPTPLVPGSAEWLRRMSASKIAAVVGLSPYESRYSLWMRMAGLVPQQPQTAAMSRGHYLEPAIANWFADQHPDWTITPTGTFQHAVHAWMIASPDRLGILPDGTVVLIQCKSAGDREQWGDPGTDDFPIGYRAQVMWEMLVTGVRRCYVAVITSFLEFRWYVVDFVEAEAAYLQAEAKKFCDSLAAGERPDIDAHSATYEAVRQLHPDLEDTKVDVPAELAVAFLEACEAERDAKAAKRLASSLLAEEMGSAKAAYHGGVCVARRQCKGDGPPFLVPARNVTVSDLRSVAA